MKKKILGLFVFLILVTLPVLSSMGLYVDDKTNINLKCKIHTFKDKNIGKCLTLENWTEQDKLLPPSGAGNYFGKSVSISGIYAIIGVYSDNNNTGSAYIFKRDDTSWTEQQKLTASDGESGDYFGYV